MLKNEKRAQRELRPDLIESIRRHVHVYSNATPEGRKQNELVDKHVNVVWRDLATRRR